jgi:hypothetical protein
MGVLKERTMKKLLFIILFLVSAIAKAQISDGELTISGTQAVSVPGGVSINSTVTLSNDVASDSGQVIGLATATYTAGVVIAQSTAAGSCYLIPLNNASRTSGGAGYITKIILLGSTGSTNNSVTGTIGITVFSVSAGGTVFASGANYQPSAAVSRGIVFFDSVQVSTRGTSGASIFRGIKSCFWSYKCDPGSVLYMRLHTDTDMLLKEWLWWRVDYARN